jgi:hypothetical protein
LKCTETRLAAGPELRLQPPHSSAPASRLKNSFMAGIVLRPRPPLHKRIEAAWLNNLRFRFAPAAAPARSRHFLFDDFPQMGDNFE